MPLFSTVVNILSVLVYQSSGSHVAWQRHGNTPRNVKSKETIKRLVAERDPGSLVPEGPQEVKGHVNGITRRAHILWLHKTQRDPTTSEDET